MDPFNDSAPNDNTCEAIIIVFRKYELPITKNLHKSTDSVCGSTVTVCPFIPDRIREWKLMQNILIHRLIISTVLVVVEQ
jgi:hypothetical protein